MPRVTYVRILGEDRIRLSKGYLGYDEFEGLTMRVRETLFQYYLKHEGLVFHTMSGFFTVLPGNASELDEKMVYQQLNQMVEHGVSFVSVSHSKPYTTLLLASKYLFDKPGFTFLAGETGEVVIALFDYSSELPPNDLALSVYVSKYYCAEISKLMFRNGGLLLECRDARSVGLLDPSSISEFLSLGLDFKVGIGKAVTPLQAYVKAQRSLDRGIPLVE
ncbi:hypothetical protein IMZ38_03160 [Thermosphaera chiliense]|uniref:GTP cyclohydrolase IIa n=1 Tax=Thermosphaera chiliense TaxID=3402707 RepID=A0A7M1USG0_9CREN|nr:hypothetical protein [Thermosphaera aggregans]QOR94919.1 hypothetical protein IMZ38_03160 [Thermosphaera aggregans]